MRFSIPIFALLVSLSLPFPLLAMPDDEVKNCPSAEAIKAEGLSEMYNLFSTIYTIFQVSHYDTDKLWYFGIGPFDTNHEDDILDRANALLMTLSDPIELEPNHWMCIYDVADDQYLAAAFRADYTPSPYATKRHFLIKRSAIL